MNELHLKFHKNINKDVSIYIGKGISNDLSELLRPLHPDKVFVVCDTTIQKLYAVNIMERLSKSYSAHLIVHEPGEVSKNLSGVMQISDEFFAGGGTSKSCICALGGGVTGNMAGLFAALVYRGIKLVHLPTTLLAQADSAPAVKQSVNSSIVKNSIGAYKAPDLVIIDPEFLKTLEEREVRSGLGEALKQGFSQDMKLVEYITSMDLQSLEAMEHVITRAIDLKGEHWESTPDMWNTPHKVERLTHVGHTTGKVLEMINVDYLTHGEAISHGTVIEAYMSHKLGYLDLTSVEKIVAVLKKMQLLYPLSDEYTPQSILSRLYRSTDEPIFALLRKLGDPNTLSEKVPKDVAQESINWYFENKRRFHETAKSTRI